MKLSPLEDIVDTIAGASRGKLTKKQVHNIIKATFEIIADEVFGIIGDKKPRLKRFVIPKFGIFYLKRRRARAIKDPKGQPRQLPATEQLGFRASKHTKRVVP